MFNRFRLKRQIALTLIVTMVMQFVYAGVAYALSEGPAQPEAMQFEPVDVTDMVNLQTGDFVYSLPLMEVPGPEGGFPISMSYHAGIGTNQEPTWVGLGWSLNPGSINRSLNGYPDDFKGDLVETHYESNVIRYEASSFGVGWGPVGLNFTNVNNCGWGLTGMSVGITIPGTPVSISMGVNNGRGFGSIGVPGFNIGFAEGRKPTYSLSTGLYGYGFGLSLSADRGPIYSLGNGLVGFSFGSGTSGSNFSLMGVGFSSSSQVDFKDAIVHESSSGVFIPLPYGFWISFGSYEYTWQLNQTYAEDAYGYIHQPYYHNSTSPTKKYERQLQDRWLYPSQDIYAANAQGVSGTFMPFVKSAYMLLDRAAPNEKAILKYEDTGFGPYDIGNYPIFKFLGDEGSNFTTKDGGTELPSVTGWGEDYQNIYGNYTDEKYSGKKIFADIDAESGKIRGFKITDIDGKIYEFYKPVFNYTMYSHSTSTQNQLTLNSYAKITVPFASNWLLTAVKGPDYVDVSGSPSGTDEQDYGYWVKFNYATNSLKQPWRSPYTGTAPGSINYGGEMYASGIREVVYLTSIETPTHKADFETSASKNSNIAPSIAGDLNITRNQNTLRVHTISGDWTTYIQNSQPNDIIITAKAWYSYLGLTYNVTVRKSDIQSFNYDPLTNNFTITEIVTPISVGGNSFIFYADHNFLVGNLVQQQFEPVTKQLDQIVLYKKSGTNSYTRLKSVKMNYDYSLCQQTPNSADPNKGKLTLNSVEFLDKLNSSSIPPYKFEYANDAPANTELNPNFDENDWDRWGGYRDGAGGADRDKYKHMTPQDKSRADKVAAWSLTKVIHPSGSEIAVEYESDDYYHVNEDIDLTYSTRAGINVTPYGSRNYVQFTSSIPNQIIIGEKIHLYTQHLYCYGDDRHYQEYFLEERTVTNINSSTNTVTFDGNFDFIESYGSMNECPYDIFDYDVVISPPTIYGGGIRVKSITMNENDKIHKTAYSYKNQYGFSSGVTYSLPAQYKYFEVGFPSDTQGETYGEHLKAYMHNAMSYGRPAPGVIYSTVEVANVDPENNNITLNGKTKYEFFTAKDAPYTLSSNSGIVTIDNRSGIAGKPKKVTYYQQYVDNGIKYKPLKVDCYTYNYSDEMNNNSQVVKVDNEVRTVLPSNYPLGITQEKYRFSNESSGSVANVNKKFQNVYLTKTETKEYFYSGETIPTPSDSMTTTTKIFEWDARSGISVSVATKDSRNDKIRIERNQPASWKYAFETTLEPKNMLSQRFQSSTYLPVGFDFNNLKNYSFPTTDIVSSNVTTWASLGTNGDYTYRVNDVLVYDNSYAYVDLTYNELRNTDVGFKRPSTQSPWRTISNITKYDRYSHPIEESLFEYPRYASAQYGYNEALPEAIINGGGGSLNMLGNEASYLSFESGGLNSQTYCKSEDDRWSLYTNNYISSDAHTGNYSFKILGGSPSYGPTKDFKPRDLANQQRQYKFSFWVKTESGFTNGSLVFHSKADDDNNNNAYPNVTGAVVTAPITDTQGKWVYVEGIIDLGKVRTLGSIPNSTLLRIRCFPQNNSQKYMLVDDFRFQPVDANMVTYTYDPITWNVISITDNNNVTTYYEYDDSGRLIKVREQDKKIVKTYDYQFGRSLSN